MKRFVFAALLAVCASAPGTAVQAADYKVGVVDVGKVLENAPQAKSARKRIQREFEPKDRQLIKQQKELQKLEDKLVRDGAVMAESERSRLEGDIRSARREIRRAQEEFREDLNLRRNQELGKLQKKVLVAIRDLAKKEKYDLIIGDGVIYAGKRVDITNKVISTLKK